MPPAQIALCQRMLELNPGLLQRVQLAADALIRRIDLYEYGKLKHKIMYNSHHRSYMSV